MQLPPKIYIPLHHSLDIRDSGFITTSHQVPGDVGRQVILTAVDFNILADILSGPFAYLVQVIFALLVSSASYNKRLAHKVTK